MALAAKYQKETNPLPKYAYEIILLADDKNSYDVLETYDTLEEAIVAQKAQRTSLSNIHINMRPLPNDGQ
jgi:hypothetical protein